MDNNYFTGKRVLITGGTSGIGLELVKELKRRDAAIVICGRDPATLFQTCERHEVLGTPCDISDSNALVGLTSYVVDELGGLDIVIQAAGIQRSIDFCTGKMSGHGLLARELDVNLKGPLELTQLVLPLLSESQDAKLVFFTSILAMTPKASAPLYCASKAGLASFVQSIRYQLANLGIQVVEVVPPVVDTPMTANRGGSKVSAEFVANHVANSLEQGRDRILIGQARVATLMNRLAPSLLTRMLIRE